MRYTAMTLHIPVIVSQSIFWRGLSSICGGKTTYTICYGDTAQQQSVLLRTSPAWGFEPLLFSKHMHQTSRRLGMSRMAVTPCNPLRSIVFPLTRTEVFSDFSLSDSMRGSINCRELTCY